MKTIRRSASALAIGALAITGCATSVPAPAARPAAVSQGAPAGFQVLSMSFVSDHRGFALGTVKCGSIRCAAVLGTINGGTSWHSLAAPTKRAGSAYNTCPSSQPCVSQIRFATPAIGYAFDPSLYLTADGGRQWHRLGGLTTSSLEAADDNAVRVASAGLGCGGQPYKVQSAPIGTATWHALPSPGITMICPPTLYRQGDRLVAVGFGNPAGGVRATAAIARSDNGGASWHGVPDRCGGRDGYTASVAIAPPDVLVLLCRHQMPNPAGNYGPAWIRVSANGGVSFGPDEVVRAAAGLSAGAIDGYQIAAASDSRLLVVETSSHGNKALLTTNGGRAWSAELSTEGAGNIILVGFEDPLTARIAQGGRDGQVWTTYNGGTHWIAQSFQG